MYSQILVPLDGSDFSARACTVAARVAERSDAPIRLLAFAADLAQRDDLERDLAERAGLLKEQTTVPVDYRTVVDATSDPAAAIVAEVDREPGSLVCMSSVGRSRLEPVLGSVAEAVLRDVSTPVLLVGPTVDVAHFVLRGDIEVPVDGSKHSEAVLPIAASWSIVYGLGVRVVTVAPGDPDHRVDRLESWMETGYVRHVAERIRRDTERRADFDVLHGDDVGERLVDDAGRYSSLVAMATHGRSGVRRVAAGSVTMHVVHHATVPVLAYRPLALRPRTSGGA
jgi:nucleotide-binding universal stress UspA family protein